MKMKAASEIGISAQHIQLPSSISQSSLIQKVDAPHQEPNIHGIIVQMPLEGENQYDTDKVVNTILPSKDVDGLTNVSVSST